MLLRVVILLFTLLRNGQAKFHNKLPNGGEIKAVLMAGSNDFSNYRHQADICHSYQLLLENGIPEENIILIMYDDIAYNKDNLYKGVIINRPGGPNVYENTKADYTGLDVNKKVLFDVLLGNEEALEGVGSGRVLESGPMDHVFFYFVGHGGPGYFLLPGDEEITASELIEVLQIMSSNARFAKMFIYIEACFSGSMFDNLLPDNLNIFAMTAADTKESSYSVFYDETLQTWLADKFSVQWMQFVETMDLGVASVHQQFQRVRRESNDSHVEEYGNLDIGSTKLFTIMGYREQPLEAYYLNLTDAVPAFESEINVLRRLILSAKSLNEQIELENQLEYMLQRREYILQLLTNLERNVEGGLKSRALQLRKKPALTKRNLGCYEKAQALFNKICINTRHDSFLRSQFRRLINLCDVVAEDELLKKLKSLCQK